MAGKQIPTHAELVRQYEQATKEPQTCSAEAASIRRDQAALDKRKKTHAKKIADTKELHQKQLLQLKTKQAKELGSLRGDCIPKGETSKRAKKVERQIKEKLDETGAEPKASKKKAAKSSSKKAAKKSGAKKAAKKASKKATAKKVAKSTGAKKTGKKASKRAPAEAKAPAAEKQGKGASCKPCTHAKVNADDLKKGALYESRTQKVPFKKGEKIAREKLAENSRAYDGVTVPDKSKPAKPKGERKPRAEKPAKPKGERKPRAEKPAKPAWGKRAFNKGLKIMKAQMPDASDLVIAEAVTSQLNANPKFFDDKEVPKPAGKNGKGNGKKDNTARAMEGLRNALGSMDDDDDDEPPPTKAESMPRGRGSRRR